MTKVTQYSKAPSEGGIILHEESYRYDALGRRIQVVSDGEETISVYDGQSFMANEWARFNAAGEVVQRFSVHQQRRPADRPVDRRASVSPGRSPTTSARSAT